MGHCKIDFYNPYDVYLHDTPQKALFGENARFHSSGCVRVDQIEAGGQTIVKVQKGIEDGRTNVIDTVNVVSGSLIIEAEEDSIGSADKPLEINLKAGATLGSTTGRPPASSTRAT